MNCQRKSNLIAQFVLVFLLAGTLPTMANKELESTRFEGKSGGLVSTGRKRDFCALLESNGYKSKFRTVALLFSPPEAGPGRGGSDDIFFSADCKNKDYFAKADFSNPRGMADLEKIWKTRSKTEPTIIEFEFSGRSSVSRFPTVGEFGWLRASFEINRIENFKLIDSPRNFPDLKADSPIIRKGSIFKTSIST